MFRKKLSYYIRSRTKIHFCLPAFPCKSCNPEKVAGLWPDGAEFEALTNIYAFCNEVRNVYPPGCVFEIISDGHVFSDCIGVDDDVVTEYDARLCEMAIKVRANFRDSKMDHNCVQFKSLNDLLQPLGWTKNFLQRSFAKVNVVDHPVTTSRNSQDDLNRGFLLRACATDPSYLQMKIREDPSSDTTMLYRGFSRFMLDDLATHPTCKDKSKSQRKKLAEKVAFEMMHRNAAYSNLVELMLPRHVRLSIHAHNNSGPKFAISLLSQTNFQPLTSFDGLRLSSRDNQYDVRHHLHIPTPWHNCLVEVEGEFVTYVCKAGLVKEELGSADCVWSSRSGYDADHPRGGRYMLYRSGDEEGGVALKSMPSQAMGNASVLYS